MAANTSGGCSKGRNRRGLLVPYNFPSDTIFKQLVGDIKLGELSRINPNKLKLKFERIRFSEERLPSISPLGHDHTPPHTKKQESD